MHAMEDIKGYGLEWLMASNNEIYTQKEIEKQVKRGHRPDIEDLINPVLAQYRDEDGKIDEEWHWEKKVWRVTTPELCLMAKHWELTFKEVVEHWNKMEPMHKGGKRSTPSAEYRQERVHQYKKQKEKAKDFFEKYDLNPPKTVEEYRMALEIMGTWSQSCTSSQRTHRH